MLEIFTTELSKCIRIHGLCTCEHFNSLANGMPHASELVVGFFSPLADCWEDIFHNLNPDTIFSCPDRGSGLWYSVQVLYPVDHIGLSKRFFHLETLTNGEKRYPNHFPKAFFARNRGKGISTNCGVGA